MSTWYLGARNIIPYGFITNIYKMNSIVYPRKLKEKIGKENMCDLQPSVCILGRKGDKLSVSKLAAQQLKEKALDCRKGKKREIGVEHTKVRIPQLSQKGITRAAYNFKTKTKNLLWHI